MERGFVFERFHERQKVGRCGITLKQYVQVIGHQTVGTKGEGSLRRKFGEGSLGPISKCGLSGSKGCDLWCRE